MVNLQFIGIGLVVVGVLLVITGMMTSGKVQGGGVIFLGPIPIAFGEFARPEYSTALWILGIALFILAIILFAFFARA